jgi:hypothetical protein
LFVHIVIDSQAGMPDNFRGGKRIIQAFSSDGASIAGYELHWFQDGGLMAGYKQT